MALDLFDAHCAYPDVVYTAECYRWNGQERWGVRSTYVLPETDDLTSWMNYHSGVTTESQAEQVVARLDELERAPIRRKVTP